MAHKGDDTFKADLDRALRNLEAAQMRIRRLEAMGMSKAELKSAMLRFGFGDVTLEEFLNAETVENVVCLLGRVNPNRN